MDVLFSLFFLKVFSVFDRLSFISFCFFLFLGDGLGEGYGMLGQAGSGKLRMSAGPSKLAAKVAKK